LPIQKKDKSSLVGLYANDVLTDYQKDEEKTWQELSEIEKKKMGQKVGRMSFGMVNKHFDEIVNNNF